MTGKTTDTNCTKQPISAVFLCFALLCPLASSLLLPQEAYCEDVAPGFIAELLYMYDELPGQESSRFNSPGSIVPSKAGDKLYITNHTARQVAVFDIASGTFGTGILLPKEPTGCAVSPDGSELFVTCYSDKRPMSIVCRINTATASLTGYFSAGHSAEDIEVSPDGSKLYVCNKFENAVSVYSAVGETRIASIPVIREPASAKLTPDGTILAVANLLPNSRTDIDTVMSSVTLISTQNNQVICHIPLANGSHSMAEICISRDGKYAYVSNILARFQIPPADIRNGWISSNGLSIIDIRNRSLVNSIMLDDVGRGAANSWGIALSDDDNYLCVTHAGSNELTILDRNEMHTALTNATGDLSYKITFAAPFKQRIQLSAIGPRSVCVVSGKAYVPGYFSGNMDIVDLAGSKATVVNTVSLGDEEEPDAERDGERIFYTAEICFQKWQSCASCHPGARTDGLNWDLLNDGAGNPKDVKSMVLAHITPPAMASGVRDSAEIGVRAGIQYILFAQPVEEDAVAIDSYLKMVRPVPSPFLVAGKLSESAERGRELFTGRLSCTMCHPAPLYADLAYHDVGTRGPLDQRTSFDTPTLHEVWRTAPYMHDGRYSDIRNAIALRLHSLAHTLTESEIDDLVAFVLSL